MPIPVKTPLDARLASPLSIEDELTQLRAQNAALQQALNTRPSAGKLSFKIGEKGGVSVCGLGRFPTTLYAGQWSRLLAQVDDLRAFLDANASLLSTKADKVMA